MLLGDHGVDRVGIEPTIPSAEVCFLNTSYQIVLNCKVRLNSRIRSFVDDSLFRLLFPKATPKERTLQLYHSVAEERFTIQPFKATDTSRMSETKSSFSTLFNFTELLYRNLVS